MIVLSKIVIHANMKKAQIISSFVTNAKITILMDYSLFLQLMVNNARHASMMNIKTSMVIVLLVQVNFSFVNHVLLIMMRWIDVMSA